MNQHNSHLTRGQLERKLSQQIQALYREELGHQPSKVTCQLFDEKLAIVIEDSITPTETVLAENGKSELAKQVRSDLAEAIQPHLRQLIEEILSVPLLDLLCDAKIETGRTGMIAVLAKTPTVRNPESIPKIKKSALSN